MIVEAHETEVQERALGIKRARLHDAFLRRSQAESSAPNVPLSFAHHEDNCIASRSTDQEAVSGTEARRQRALPC